MFSLSNIIFDAKIDIILELDTKLFENSEKSNCYLFYILIMCGLFGILIFENDELY